MTRWRSLLLMVLGLSLGVAPLAAAQEPSTEAPQADASAQAQDGQTDFTTAAQKFIDAARDLLEAKKQARQERLEAERREQEEHLEAKARAKQARLEAKRQAEEAKRQAKAAREQAKAERFEAKQQARSVREQAKAERLEAEQQAKAAHKQAKAERLEAKRQAKAAHKQAKEGRREAKARAKQEELEAKRKAQEGKEQAKAERLESEQQTKSERLEAERQTKSERLEAEQQAKSERLEAERQAKAAQALAEAEQQAAKVRAKQARLEAKRQAKAAHEQAKTERRETKARAKQARLEFEHKAEEAKRFKDDQHAASEKRAQQAYLNAKRRADEAERRLEKEEERQVEATRRADKRRQQVARELTRQRQKAQERTVLAAREKLRRERLRDRGAKRQVREARARQLKRLYRKGQTLYQRGYYKDAIEVLEQMTVMAPNHSLVKAAERVIARAELKRFEQRLRASATLPPQAGGAVVSELEDLLTHRRIELDTLFQYAKVAIRGRRYDTALKLLTEVLVKDPSHREARRLMEEVQLTQIKRERRVVTRQVEHDEMAMINEVLKAQVVPPSTGRTAISRGSLLAPDVSSAITAKLQTPVSFEFKEVSLGDVLEFLSDAANISIIPSPELDLKQQAVTLKVRDMPLEQAVKYLTKSLALAYRVDQDAILIATPDQFSNEPLETRVFYLHNGLSPFALETAAVESNPLMGMDSMQDLLIQTIPQPADSRLVIDQRSGALIVTNTRENLTLTEQLLSQLDVTPIQVLIEARFVELSMTELEQAEFELLLSGNVSLTKSTDTDDTRGASLELASGSGSTFGTLARNTEGFNLTLQGILTGTQFEAVLHRLEETQRSKTLSAPRITTLNNQTATIRVVDEFRYPTRYEVSLIQFDINGDGDTDDAGEVEFANVPQDFQKRDIGILLNVTPSVGKDLRTVTLVLSPEVSNFSKFRDLGGNVTVPEFTSSYLTTSVMLEDGQTVVLGGLMTDTTTEDISKVPFLGDLPIVGGLFRQKKETSTRKNLLIFVTARILTSRGETT